jgi:ketosteroid isomerase-like protein
MLCRRLIVTLYVIAVAVACGENHAVPDTTNDERCETVLEAVHHLITVAEAGDIEGYLGCLTSDAVMMYGGRPAFSGRDSVRPFITAFFAQYDFVFGPWESKEIVVTDGWAFHRYEGIATLVPKDGGEPIVLDRKYIDIMRYENGSWKLARHIYNLNQ